MSKFGAELGYGLGLVGSGWNSRLTCLSRRLGLCVRSDFVQPAQLRLQIGGLCENCRHLGILGYVWIFMRRLTVQFRSVRAFDIHPQGQIGPSRNCAAARPTVTVVIDYSTPDLSTSCTYGRVVKNTQKRPVPGLCLCATNKSKTGGVY